MERVFTLDGDVKLYRINSESDDQGKISEGTLSIVQDKETGQKFLSLSDWKYPLIANETPILMTGEDLSTFMLPGGNEKTTIGLVLDDDVCIDSLYAFLKILCAESQLKYWWPNSSEMHLLTKENFDEKIFSSATGALSICSRKDNRPSNKSAASSLHPPGTIPPKPSLVSDYSASDAATSGEKSQSKAYRFADSITKVTELMSQKIGEVAEFGASKMRHRSEVEIPTVVVEEKEINPKLLEATEKTNAVTSTVLSKGKQVNDVVGKGTKALGEAVAAKLPSSVKDPQSKHAHFAKSALVVTSTGIVGATSVFNSLVDGALKLSRASADLASSKVAVKHGEKAGQVTENILHSAVNVGETVVNVSEVLPKNVAKNVA